MRFLTVYAQGSTFLRFSYQVVFTALFSIFCSAPVYAAGDYSTADVESLRLAIDTSWCDYAAPGYWPVRFDITNLGKDRTIELQGQVTQSWMSSPHVSGEMSHFEIRQSIRLKASEHVKLTIPVPISAENENLQLTVREGGRILRSFFPGGLQSNRMPYDTSVLLIADPATPFGAIAPVLFRHLPTDGVVPGAEHTQSVLDYILDPTRLPSNWLGFTSLRAVLIGPQEWEKLTGPQKEALLTWTASGGDFIFVDGDLAALFPDPRSQPVNLAITQSNQTPYYFGRIQRLTSAELYAFGFEDALRRMSTTDAHEYRALPVNRSSDWKVFPKYGFCLPIPGIKNLAVGSYLAIIFGFSVLIGPVNYFWVRRKRRQILIMLTTPLIAGVFMMLLSGYAFFVEGFGIACRVQSFTLLDQKTNRAATRATVSMYALGMAPGKGLRFPRDVAIFPLSIGEGNVEQMLLDFTNGQQFTKGFVQSRAPSNFEQISFRPVHERLIFNYEDGGMTVVNRLGATITRLFYRDAGKIFMLDHPLISGEKAALHPAGKSVPAVLPLKYRSLNAIPTDRTYIAWLESSPFIETGAPKVTEKGSLHLVLGYIGEKLNDGIGPE